MITYLKRRARYSLVILGLLGFVSGFAQTATITGTVKTSEGQALAGASVQFQGGGGTTTDNSGNYSLSTTAGKHILVVSYVGYATQRTEITVSSGNNTQNISLLSAGELNAVTVTGSRNPSRTRIETPVPVDVIPISTV